MPPRNEFGQPVGDDVPGWMGAARPDGRALRGRLVVLERLDPGQHAEQLHSAYDAAADGRDWTYLPVGPFAALAEYREWAEAAARSADPLHYAIIDVATGRALGTMALMRQDPANGTVEVGYVVLSRALQRTASATEAQHLLMRHAFEDLGCRRYEWKCDALNAPSRRAAERLGFLYEGTFRQAVVVKGRNRDTAWYAITEREWPAVNAAHERWLRPENFEPDGRQIEPLRVPAGES